MPKILLSNVYDLHFLLNSSGHFWPHSKSLLLFSWRVRLSVMILVFLSGDVVVRPAISSKTHNDGHMVGLHSVVVGSTKHMG